MNSPSVADEPLHHYSYWRVFFLIVAALSFVLAVGLPITGYTVIHKFRHILYEQIMHDNDAIAKFFIQYLQQTHDFYDNDEEWLRDVRQFVNEYKVPNQGYVCLIDSNAKLQAYPGIMQPKEATFTVLPYNTERHSFEEGMPISIGEMLTTNDEGKTSGELVSRDGNQLVEMQRVMIGGKAWLVGVHQKQTVVQDSIQDILPFIVGLGICLFFMIVLPFGFFTGYLIRQHEMERYQRVAQLEEHSVEIENAAKQLQESNQRLQEMQAEKSGLYGRLSHDLRAPLSSVLSACSMVADGTYGGANDKQITAMQRVERNVNVLLSLIDGILNLSRIESGFVEVKKEAVPVQDILYTLKENLEPLAEHKGLRLNLEADDSLPVIESDSEKLYLILQNLVGNAIKFTQEGEIILRAKQTVDGSVNIDVQDSGPGIREEDQCKVFEEFSSGSNGSNSDAGVGLGLTITKELTELLGGQISLKSNEGEGSVFTVTLPAAQPEKVVGII